MDLQINELIFKFISEALKHLALGVIEERR